MSWTTIHTEKTGRSRTLALSGSWSGDGVFYQYHVTDQGFPPKDNVFSNLTGHALAISQDGFWSFVAGVGPAPQTSLGADYPIAGGGLPTIIAIQAQWDSTFIGYIKPITPPSVSDSAFRGPFVPDLSPPVNHGGKGTWRLEIDVEEYFNVFQEIDDNTGEPKFPDYDGPMAEDPPYSDYVSYYELAKFGGLVKFQASYDAPKSNFVDHGTSFNIMMLASIEVPFNVNYQIDVEEGNIAGSTIYRPDILNCNLTTTYDNMFSGFTLSDSFSNSKSSGIFDCNGTDSSSSLTVAGTTVWHFRAMSLSMAYDVNINAHVFEDKNDYADPLNVFIEGLGGFFAGTSLAGTSDFGTTLHNGYVSTYSQFELDVNNKLPCKGVFINTIDALSISLSPGSLLKNREDKNDWRMGFLGPPFQAGTLSQKTSLTVDDATSLTPQPSNGMSGSWTGVTPAVMTVGASFLTITVADGNSPGKAIRSFNDYSSTFHGASFGGYRYLYIKIRGDAESLPFVVRLSNEDGSKTWNKNTGAKNVFTTIGIDLCNPDSEVVATDTVDSQWPYSGDSDYYHIKDGSYTGVTHCQSLSLESLVNTQVYDIEEIYLASVDQPKISIAPTFDNWIEEFDDDPLSDSVRVRMVMGDTDGRQSLEATDFTQDVLGNLTIRPISQVLDTLSVTQNGWSVVAATTFPDGYNTNSLDGCQLWGGGSLFAKVGDDTKPSWHSGFEIPD